MTFTVSFPRHRNHVAILNIYSLLLIHCRSPNFLSALSILHTAGRYCVLQTKFITVRIPKQHFIKPTISPNSLKLEFRPKFLSHQKRLSSTLNTKWTWPGYVTFNTHPLTIISNRFLFCFGFRTLVMPWLWFWRAALTSTWYGWRWGISGWWRIGGRRGFGRWIVRFAICRCRRRWRWCVVSCWFWHIVDGSYSSFTLL